MKKTILCHFYNEEYMLPWFLNHHKQIFDHGIMIDYHSTDRSREIIKELCPTWDIVTSRNPNFQADEVDNEVYDIESTIEGWRICLNVTELLVGDYSIIDNNPNQQLLIPTMFFVDCDRDREVTTDLPIYKQKTDGFSFRQGPSKFSIRGSRSLHNMQVQYDMTGRHFYTYTTEKLVIFYYGWCPFNKQLLDRKLQIQTQIPLYDRQRNWGFHHITNEETLTYRLENEFIPQSISIKEEIEQYVKQHENFSTIL